MSIIFVHITAKVKWTPSLSLLGEYSVTSYVATIKNTVTMNSTVIFARNAQSHHYKTLLGYHHAG